MGGTTGFYLTKLRSVQSSRWDGAIFLLIPGTSCLATSVLSLRDKGHSPHRSASHYLRIHPECKSSEHPIQPRGSLAGRFTKRTREQLSSNRRSSRWKNHGRAGSRVANQRRPTRRECLPSRVPGFSLAGGSGDHHAWDQRP
jgi:hypothetical protein